MLKKSLLRTPFLIAILFLAAIIWSPKVDAATTGPVTMSNGATIDTNLYGNILDHQLYYFLIGCFANTGSGTLSRDEVGRWDFFNFAGGGSANESVRGALYSKNQVDCNDQEWIKESFETLGFKDPFDTFCSFSFTNHTYYGGNYISNSDDALSGNDKNACLAGRDDESNNTFRMAQPPIPASGAARDYYDNHNKNLRGYNVEQVLKSKGQAGKGLSAAEEYVRAYRSLVNGGCKVNLIKKAGSFKSYTVPSGQHQIDIVNSNGSITSWFAKLDNANKKIKLVETRSGKSQDISCSQLLGIMGSNATLYSEHVKSNQDTITPAGSAKSECANSTPDCTEDTQSCGIDGIGWIVCPATNFLAGLNKQAYDFISEYFLVIRPELLDQSGKGQATYEAWKKFRDIANVLFVIAFLFIVYSQVAGVGVTNYGIKKLLPRIIISATLVNLSYILCQIAVDISNIAGSSIVSFFESMKLTSGNGTNPSTIGATWEGAATAVLGVGMSIGLILLVILAPSVLLVFAVVVMILIARQAFIVLLIVVAPVAFVAYILPNTEQWFKKWWKTLYILLLLFPIVGIVFGASSMASDIIFRIAGNDKQTLALVALGIQALPLFAVPAILKGALAATGSIGGKLNGIADKAQGRGVKGINNSRIGEAKTAFNARRQQKKVNRRLGSGRIASWGRSREEKGKRFGKTLQWAGSRGAAFDASSAGRYFGGDRGAAGAVYEQQKLNNEAVERSMALLENNPAGAVISKAQEQLVRAHERGDVVAARAATRILSSKTGSRGVDKLAETIKKIETKSGSLHDEILESVHHEVTSAALKGKNRSLDKWSRGEPTKSGGTKLHDYDSDENSVTSLNEAELAGQGGYQLRVYADTGALDPDSAKRVLDAHKKGTVHLDADKLKLFQDILNGTYNRST
jgi:hypothetical protein